jgi:anti-anti-sigma factor
MASDQHISPCEGPQRGTVEVAHLEPGLAVVTMHGEHDLSTRVVLAQALQLAAARSNVVVDLSECSFIDSTVINEFIKCSKSVHAGGERFLLVIPPDQTHVARLARVVRMAEMIELHDSKEAAFESLERGAQGEASLTNDAAGRSRWLRPSPVARRRR